MTNNPVDQWDLQDTGRALSWLFQLLEARKYEPPPPPEVKVMAPAFGPGDPLDLDLFSAEDCLLEERWDDRIPGGLRVMVMDAAEHIGKHPLSKKEVKKGHRATGAQLAAFVSDHASDIVEKYPEVDALAELMEAQARWLAFNLNPPQEAPKDPYLTAPSIQRALTARGLECPEGTIRRWASEGHVATRKRADGRTLYRLQDVQTRLERER